MNGVKVISFPGQEVIEPISVDEARRHLEAPRYGDEDTDQNDDQMIAAWISAARETAENFLGLSLVMRVYEYARIGFPNTKVDGSTAITLPMGPVLEILSVQVGSVVNSDSTPSDIDLGPDNYQLDDYSRPSRLLPLSAWPVGAGGATVRIRYLAGYGEDSDGGIPLPAAIRAAILLILGDLYANREDSSDKQMHTIPNSAESLLRPYRVNLGMA